MNDNIQFDMRNINFFFWKKKNTRQKINFAKSYFYRFIVDIFLSVFFLFISKISYYPQFSINNKWRWRNSNRDFSLPSPIPLPHPPRFSYEPIQIVYRMPEDSSSRSFVKKGGKCKSPSFIVVSMLLFDDQLLIVLEDLEFACLVQLSSSVSVTSSLDVH